MDNRYNVSAPEYLDDYQMYLQDSPFSMDSSMDELASIPKMDVTSYNGPIAHPWLSYDREHSQKFYQNSEPLSSPTSAHDEPHSRGAPGPKRKRKDPGPEGRDKRRIQNRESQQKYRERNRQAFDDMSVALDAERQTTSKLKAEVEVLESTVGRLEREKQECAAAMERLCHSMSGFNSSGMSRQ